MNHKMSTNNVESEYIDIVNKNAWPIVYQRIGRECQQYDYTCMEAKKPQNKLLNRYRDVNPYDHSRVVLSRGTQDYINANLVKMDKANRKYILTQGPLPDTVSHFWLMVWEQNSRAILMLNKIIEKNEIKCHWYWPQDIGPEYKMELKDVGLTIEQISAEDFSYYSTRVFRLGDTESNAFREVIQFHYTTWPDFGVPSSPNAFLEFLKKVRASGALESSVGPPVVHCSAGIGRSGTFCLVDSSLVLIEKDGLNGVNIQEILLQMRKDRMGLIQTPDQLRFSYQAIIEGAKRLDANWEINNKSTELDEEIFNTICEDEEAPPLPPPRGESLQTTLAPPPARPLPAIPASESLDNFSLQQRPRLNLEKEPSSEKHDSSDSDDTSPSRNSNNGRFDYMKEIYDGVEDKAATGPPERSLPGTPTTESENSNESDDEGEDDPMVASENSVVRRRKQDILAARVANMKRKQQSSEKWNHLKRSLYKPVAISIGVLICGLIVYTCVKH